MAIILAATALGVIVPVLKDTGRISSLFGQTVIAGATIADLGTVVLLSLFFSRESKSIGVQILLVGLLVLLAIIARAFIVRAARLGRVERILALSEDTTDQLRVRQISNGPRMKVSNHATTDDAETEGSCVAHASCAVLTSLDRQ